MANKTTTVEGRAQAALQRGKACLRCRKRKMRCDGNKPACQQCTRAKKGDACEYDDGKGKTRTQLLRETIVRLESRIRELEDPEYISPAITLHDPHAQHHSESSSSSYGSPGSASISASQSPFASETTNSPQGSWTHLPPGNPSPSTTSFTADMFFDEPSSFQGVYDLEPVLLDIFAPHRHQCGLEVHMGHLRESLSLPPSQQRHPALMNAIYLWACFVSRPEPLCQHEDHFLAQALDGLREGLRVGDKIVDVIQASCIISVYFLANGRILEGSYHSSAAAALAVQCRLQTGLMHDSNYVRSCSMDSFDMKPMKGDYREAEAILAFWQVYNLDRCWSVALQKPCVIPDGVDTWNSINCPWPQTMEDYESGTSNAGTSFRTVRSFLSGDVSPDGFSVYALRAKASALFSTADHIATTMEDRLRMSGAYHDEIQSIEVTITQFISTLIPVHQLDATMPEDRSILLTTHTLAHAALIRLYQRLAQTDAMAYDKCTRAARACVTIVKHIGDSSFKFLDPIVGTCWTSAADILIRELNSIETTWPLISTADVRTEIGTLLYAMTNLSSRFPILAVSASKIQKRLAEI